MFSGIHTALVTPFTKTGQIDEKALRALVDEQIAAGINGLVPVGSTGESPTVDHQENIRVIEIVVDQAAGRVPVMAGTGSNSTAEAIQMTQAARKIGATASLQIAPYYNKPSQEGFYRHFAAIADAVDLPMVLYNIPGRTAKNVSTETILRLAGHPNIVGIKEASGSLDQVMDVIAGAPAGFEVLCGDDSWTLSLLGLGASGVISVASHLVAPQLIRMYQACQAGRLDEARSIHYQLLPLFRALFLDTNPIPVKYALSRLGKIEEIYRLPLCPTDAQTKAAVDAALRQTGLIK